MPRAVLEFPERSESEPDCPALLQQGAGTSMLPRLTRAALAAAGCSRSWPAARCRRRAHGRAAPRHRDARRAGAAGRASAIFPTSIRPRRRAGGSCRACSARSTASTRSSSRALPPQGLRAPLVSGSNIIAGYVVESLMVRSYDEPFTLYGLLAEHGRDRRGAQLRDLHAQSGGALLRRQAGDRRRRRLLLAAAARQGPAEPPHLLFQGREGRDRSPSARCASISPAATTASCR